MADPEARGSLCFLVPAVIGHTRGATFDPVAHYYARLAEDLAARGWQVHIVTESTPGPETRQRGVTTWDARTLALEAFADRGPKRETPSNADRRRAGERVDDLLRDCHPLHGRSAVFHHALLALGTRQGELDLIAYPDVGALGFIPALQHRSRCCYGRARLVCTLHGPLLFLRAAAEIDHVDLETLKVAWLERSAFEKADVRLAVSTDVGRWSEARWTLQATPPSEPCQPWRQSWRQSWRQALPEHRPRPQLGSEVCLLGTPNLDETASLPAFLTALAGSPRTVRFLGVNGQLAFTFSSPSTSRAIEQAFRGTPTRSAQESIESLDQLLERLADDPALMVFLPRACPVPHPVVLELLHRGLPFVISDVDSIPETLGPELTSRLAVPPRDPAAIQKWIDELCALDAGDQHDLMTAIHQRWRQLQDTSEPIRTLERAVATPRARPAAPALPASTPEVAVVIPFYNTAPYLDACLDSLERQTGADFEIIVVDDGSDDPESLDLLRDVAQNRPAVRLLRKANGGVGDAMNHALANTRAQLMIELDADNIARPELVATLTQGRRNRPELAGLSCHNATFYDSDEPALVDAPASYRQHARWYWRMIGPALPVLFFENIQGDACGILSTEALRAIGGYPDDKRGFHDWGVWLKLLAHGHAVDVLPEVLYFHRQRPGSDGQLKKWFYVDQQNQRLISDLARQQPDVYSREILPDLHLLCRQAVTLEARQTSLFERGLRSLRDAGPRATARRVLRWLRGQHALHQD
ncbi:MAG: glycosyltransferase [Acidobacteriota bacterium]